MPPLAVCAVTDDEHVGDIVAVARWLESARAFTPRYLHVINDGAVTTGVPTVIDPPLAEASLAALVPGHAVEVVAGPIVDELERRADELGAAMFVVGSRGRRPVAAMLAGSVSRTLLTRGTRPVLVARRARVTPEGLGPVVCGVTRPLGRAQTVARTAAGLARRLERPLLVAMVVDPPLGDRMRGGASLSGARWESAADVADATLFLEEIARWLDVPDGVSTSVVVGSASAVLTTLGEDTGAAMLVVGCRGHGALGAMITGSVSRALIRKAARPLVVVPLRHRP